jgi:hypothetical protein
MYALAALSLATGWDCVAAPIRNANFAGFKSGSRRSREQ